MLDRGKPNYPTPLASHLSDLEGRVKQLSVILEDYIQPGTLRAEETQARLQEAINTRNQFLWSIPNIRAMVESIPELNSLSTAPREKRWYP